MQERRKYVRVPENLQIIYDILSADIIRACLTKDISQGGVRFFTHKFIPKDSCLKVRFTFSRVLFSFEALVKCKWIRKIQHSDEFEVGVEFIDLPLEVVKHLISYIKDYIDTGGNKKAEKLL